ncbi:MAG: hypothetical protein RL580_855 [Pseudomonadota bacterium]|jgi:hypothetical protein
MSAWRNYRDDQWLRLAGAVEAAATEVLVARPRFGQLSRIALAIAPILGMAAFLQYPAAIGRSVATEGCELEKEMRLTVRSVAAAACVITSVAQGQNLIQNGGLEGPAGSCAHFFVDPGSNQIPSWVVSGSWNVDWLRSAGPGCACPFEGSYFVDLNGSPNWVSGSAIQQTITTVSGQRYVLRLRAAPNDYNTPLGTVKVLRLTTGQQVTDIPLTTVEFSCPGSWLPIEVPFVASGTQSVIELRSTFPNNAGGIIVDDISVTAAPPRDIRVPADFPTIAAAVAASGPSDRILVAPGTYPWAGIEIPHSLTIEGTGGAAATRIEGNGAETAFLFSCAPGASGSVTLRGLTITRGRGVYATNGALVVERCMFAHNTQGLVVEDLGGFGGAVLTNCAFVRNGSSSLGQAGGVGIYTASPGAPGAMLANCMFLDNTAQEGGGLHVSHSATSATDCIFARNSATLYSGGAIARWWGHVAIPLTNCVFMGNTAAWSGTQNWNCCVNCSGCGETTSVDTTSDCNGNMIPDSAEILVDPSIDTNQDGIPDTCGSTIVVPTQFATIQAAIDSVPAGAARVISVLPGTYNQSFALNGKNVVVRGAPKNATILDGAGLTTSIVRFSGGEPATAGIENLVLRNGTVGSLIFPKASFRVGGGLYAANSSAYVKDCRFESNRSNFGGAAYLYRSSTSVDGCQFVSNTATSEGGALQLFESSGPITDSTFAGNSAGPAGAGAASALKVVGARTAGGTVLVSGCAIQSGTGGTDTAAVEMFENAGSGALAGVLRIADTVISGNSAATGAGGLRVAGSQSSCVLAGGTSICSNLPRNVTGPFLIEGSATVCDCLADLTLDGMVNGADLGVVLAAWGAASPNGAGDANHDGAVNGADLAQVLASWGACP